MGPNANTRQSLRPWIGVFGLLCVATLACAQVPYVNRGPLQGAADGARAEHAACMRQHASTLALIDAARSVIRTRDNLQRDRSQGRNVAYGESELERNWKYYKSQGGTAASPEQVSVPEDPCRESAQAVQRQMGEAQEKYRECAAARAGEVRLAQLSKEVVDGRQWLAMAEKMQEEKRRNPSLAAEGAGRGEWRGLDKVDPVQARAALGQQFAAYRGAGGTAARIEDVTLVPNPCISERSSAQGPSPIRREAVIFPPHK
jgi:hypothetical protein